nr:hypothetical protein CFP56_30669 [Quercus suber]
MLSRFRLEMEFHGLRPMILQDGASSHTARAVQKALERANFRVIRLCPYSPDLNPIEHVWAWIKNALRRCHWITTIPEMLAEVTRLWNNIPDKISEIISSSSHDGLRGEPASRLNDPVFMLLRRVHSEEKSGQGPGKRRSQRLYLMTTSIMQPTQCRGHQWDLRTGRAWDWGLEVYYLGFIVRSDDRQGRGFRSGRGSGPPHPTG